MSDASEADVLEPVEDDKLNGDVGMYNNAGADDTHNAGNAIGLNSASESDQSETSHQSSSHVRLLVSSLESRYSARVGLPTQPPPALQSCPKITALQDSLISKVQDPGISRASLAIPENSPKVTTVRDTLVSRAQVPGTSKLPPPTLQSCPKITALRETLISRVQGYPGAVQTSRTPKRDLAECPSVASIQTALLDLAWRTPLQKRATTTASFPPLKNVPSNSRDVPVDGQSDSTDEPEMDRLRVVLSNCQDELRGGLSSRGDELVSAPPNDKDGPKWQKVEDGPTNLREVPEDDLVKNGDGPDRIPMTLGNFQEGEKIDETVYGEECGCGEIPKNVPSNYGYEPDTSNNSGAKSMSNSLSGSVAHSESTTVVTLPESRHFVQLPAD